MKILHTSDWHLGCTLHGKKRYKEHEEFLTWLKDCIRRESIDTLLVAGDIFDTSTPGSQAQAIYYRFLYDIASSGCRHVVITGGNHDSPSFLNAPKDLLKTMNIHVLGAVTGNPDDEVLILSDADDRPGLIICAIPFLRDRDVRTARPGECFEDKATQLREGIVGHITEVCARAEEERQIHGSKIPIIMMAHLFLSGGTTVSGDGVRDLYIGSLESIGSDIIPPSVSYVALGHLHVPQRIGKSDRIRYCGSPLPIGFGEAKQQKYVVILETSDQTSLITSTIPVPVFRRLERVKGDLTAIRTRIQDLCQEDEEIWMEVEYTGTNISPSTLHEQIQALVDGKLPEVLVTKNTGLITTAMAAAETGETLDDLDETEVFRRCMEQNEIPEEDRDDLLLLYQEALLAIHDTEGEEA